MARVSIDLASGKLKPQNVIVGIDLGTTNSLIARMSDGQPEAIADFGKSVIVPSVIHFVNGVPEVGETAKEYLVQDPENTLYSVKRLMGKSFKDLAEHAGFFSYRVLDTEDDSLVRVRVGDRFYTPVELSAVILAELKHRAEHKLKVPVERAVITVPAYFNDAQRQATRDAGKLAGLDVLRIVNEPTAAALAYGLGLRADETRTVAVYDLGGGTFDITILRIEGGIFEVLATHGDTFLGGDDFDRAIAAHWVKEYGLEKQIETDRAAYQALRLKAEEAKKELSTTEAYETAFLTPNSEIALRITRTQFEELTRPLLERTLESCSAALRDANLAPQDLDAVLLVGGSTRMPTVKAGVEKRFGKRPDDSLDPDQVVALGAAVQADILAGNRKDLLLLDVTPLSLGIETLGGLMDVLVPRNSKIPAKVSRQYTTSRDGQVNLRVSVFQGERETVTHNRKLAEFELRGIPPMPAGLPKVEISFLIDADGILRVEARELRSGIRQEIAVKPQYGLTDDAVEQMLLDSLTNARTDVAERMILEAVQEGEQLVYNAGRFLEKYGEHFSETETAGLQALIQKLQALLPVQDKDAILAAIEETDAYSKPLAERVMNKAVGSALRGRNALGE